MSLRVIVLSACQSQTYTQTRWKKIQMTTFYTIFSLIFFLYMILIRSVGAEENAGSGQMTKWTKKKKRRKKKKI